MECLLSLPHSVLDADKQTNKSYWRLKHLQILIKYGCFVRWLNLLPVRFFSFFFSFFLSFFNESHPPSRSSLSFLESHFWKATSLCPGTNERDNCGRVCITILSVMCLVTPYESSNSALMSVLICCLIALESRIN